MPAFTISSPLSLRLSCAKNTLPVCINRWLSPSAGIILAQNLMRENVSFTQIEVRDSSRE